MPIIHRNWEDQLNPVSLTSEFTAEAEHSYRVDPTDGSFDIYLPAASGLHGQDIEFYVEYSGVNNITLIASGSDLINGSSEYDINDLTNIRLTSNGHNEWKTFYGYKEKSYAFINLNDTDAVATAINTGYKKMNGTTHLIKYRRFTMPANNRLTYVGKETTMFDINVALSCEVNVANTLVHFTFALNGEVQENFSLDRHLSNANDHGALAMCGVIELSQNDYIELFAKGNKSANLTVDHMSFIIKELA